MTARFSRAHSRASLLVAPSFVPPDLPSMTIDPGAVERHIASQRMRNAGGQDASGPIRTVSDQSPRLMKTRKTDDRVAQSTRMGFAKLRRSWKTGRWAASHAGAGWIDRLWILVCSSGPIVGLGRAAAAW